MAEQQLTSIVMRLWGAADGQATPFDGQFLKDFDFEANDGLGEIDMTPDIEEAKRFDSMAEALAYYQRSPAGMPGRRPLTSTNWEFTSVKHAERTAT